MKLSFGYAIVYVKSVPETIAFWEAAFGFEDSFVHEGEDYGELKSGNTKLAFTSHELAANAVPSAYRKTEDGEPLGFEFTLVTKTVDDAFAKAVQVGAVPLAEPHDTSWGQRVAYVKDLNGVLVGLGSPMGD